MDAVAATPDGSLLLRPNQPVRVGSCHSDVTSCQLLPPSADRNSPPGSVPAHSVPWAAARLQIRPSFQAGPVASAGWGG